MEKFQNEELIKNYKLRQGRGGFELERNECSAFDHFGGGNALLDLEVGEEFTGLEW